MNLPPAEIAKEKEYLKITLKIIQKLIEASNMSIQDKMNQINEIKKYIWENKATLDEIEIAQGMYNVNTGVGYTNDSIKQLQRLEKSLESAYFGRIDFIRDNNSFSIYIGLNGISNGLDFYVFDWRAPIASLFYNYGKGPAMYEAPSGLITGDITLKRQYKIIKDRIERCFDNDINIDDEYLQEILSDSSSDRIKNIVNTIQQDQNAIIRNVTDPVLIVQGIAGSGKTSVALHRIAFLLYKEKNLHSSNILIFSPNQFFSEYISNVLPELGEDNVMQTTFSDFGHAYIKDYKELESFTEFIERYYKQITVDQESFNITKAKLSNEFKNFLDEYIKNIKNTTCFTSGLKINGIQFNKKMLDDYFKNRYSKLPLFERIQMLTEYICDTCNISHKKNGELIRERLLGLLSQKFDIKKIYKEFLNSNKVKSLAANISDFNPETKKLKYEDLTPILYLTFELKGYPKDNFMKQIIIDEAQDYSLLQIELIKRIFSRASFTILGDHSQTINPYYKYRSLEEIQQVFLSGRYIELNKAYRSSEEIINYTNQILGLSNVCSVRKSNEIPVVFKNVEDDNQLVEQMLSDIETMKNDGMKRIAIITKNNEEMADLYGLLSYQTMDIAMVNFKRGNNNSNTLIMPSYISKGLEFDGVIAYTRKDNQYNNNDRFLFYVVCTRAQHSLVIYNQEDRGYNKELCRK